MSAESFERPQAAGEGGRLPKGLSLFRFILFSCLMLGAAWGGLSLYAGAPPPPGYTPPNGIPAAQWEPSPLWLPNYLVLKTGLGAARTPNGYAFRGRLGYALHAGASIFVGILILGGAGWIAGERVRRWSIRRREGRVQQAVLNARRRSES
ncbi:MAG: hypothetical protein M5U26_13390 [Planctomycetota bacterium]|nr:hypothetical protein [Planctomycetota bacterium]